MSFTYLASPYTHSDPKVMDRRYYEALIATKWLLTQRIWVYSPIVHCHPIAQSYQLPADFSFWRDYNFAMLEKADDLMILALNGWKESRGVTDEIDFAFDHTIPIRFLTLLGEFHGEYTISDPPNRTI